MRRQTRHRDTKDNSSSEGDGPTRNSAVFVFQHLCVPGAMAAVPVRRSGAPESLRLCGEVLFLCS